MWTKLDFNIKGGGEVPTVTTVLQTGSCNIVSKLFFKLSTLTDIWK